MVMEATHVERGTLHFALQHVSTITTALLRHEITFVMKQEVREEVKEEVRGSEAC